jgi:hypothetical protein
MTNAISQIHAEGKIGEFEEFQKDGIYLDLFWNSNEDDMVCDECRSRHGVIGPWDENPPPFHGGCRYWIAMRIKNSTPQSLDKDKG